MKAVVVELKNNLAAVLSDDGCIVTVKNNDYEIGQIIQMSNPRIHFTKKVVAFATSAAAIVLLSVGTWAYASPYTYVSLDVNPSIEFSVNRFDRVLRVNAVNDDGEEILNQISLTNLKNKTIQDALTLTVGQISEAGYFDGDIEGAVVITTSSKGEEDAEELAQELQQSVINEATENGDDIVVEAVSVGLERTREARELGVTPGKLNLVEKLQASASDPNSINLEEWLNKPVKDIMKATKDNKEASVTSDSTIIIDGEEQQVNDDNEQKSKEKEVLKEAKKAKDDAKKAADKELKAAEKAKLAEEKALDKTKDTASKYFKKSQKEIDKDVDKVKDTGKKQTEKLRKEIDRAIDKVKEDARKAKPEKEKLDNETDRNAQKTTDDADKNSEKGIDDADKNAQKGNTESDNTSQNVNDDAANASQDTIDNSVSSKPDNNTDSSYKGANNNTEDTSHNGSSEDGRNE
jgi:hypothetical protein